MDLNQDTKIIMVRSGGRYGSGALFYLDTPIFVSTKDGKTSASWSNYGLGAVFYLLLYGFVVYFILAVIFEILISYPIFYLTNTWISESLRDYFGADWVPIAILAFIFSIFPFSQTWPTIFSQLKENPRRLDINQDIVIFYEKGNQHTFPKAQTRVTYAATDLFEKIPFKVVTFYFQSNEIKIPFYKVVMKMSFAKNQDYQEKSCDEFARDIETTFGLSGR